MPADASVTEILLYSHGVLLTYHSGGTRFILEYVDGDHTGHVDLLQKTLVPPEETGESGYVYSVTCHTAVGISEYSRWKELPAP